MFNDIKMFAGYAWGLKGYLRQTLTTEQCHQMIAYHLKTRDESFLRIMERGIYTNPRNPYYKLLKHARVEFPDVVRLVQQHGIEGTLIQLYEAGVYVNLNEFKGRRPIQRPGLEFPVRPQDFDNPLLAKHYEARSSGSRGIEIRPFHIPHGLRQQLNVILLAALPRLLVGPRRAWLGWAWLAKGRWHPC